MRHSSINAPAARLTLAGRARLSALVEGEAEVATERNGPLETINLVDSTSTWGPVRDDIAEQLLIAFNTLHRKPVSMDVLWLFSDAEMEIRQLRDQLAEARRPWWRKLCDTIFR